MTKFNFGRELALHYFWDCESTNNDRCVQKALLNGHVWFQVYFSIGYIVSTLFSFFFSARKHPCHRDSKIVWNGDRFSWNTPVYIYGIQKHRICDLQAHSEFHFFVPILWPQKTADAFKVAGKKCNVCNEQTIHCHLQCVMYYPDWCPIRTIHVGNSSDNCTSPQLSKKSVSLQTIKQIHTTSAWNGLISERLTH